MCCIIYRPKDAPEIKKEYIEKIVKKNPHGWGIAYSDKKEVFVSKSLEMNKAIDEIRRLEKLNIEFLFHARWATHGDKDLQNCHPYDLPEAVLFHNGKINIKCPNKKMSDTWHFCNVIKKRVKRHKKSFQWIINRYKNIIGDSRLAFISKNGDVLLHGKWEELEGCKYSKVNWKYEYTYSSGNYASTVGYKWSPLSLYEDEYMDIYNDMHDLLSKGEVSITLSEKLIITDLENLLLEFPEVWAKHFKQKGGITF